MLNELTSMLTAPLPGAARNEICVMRRGPPTERNCPAPKSSWYSKLAGAVRETAALPVVVACALGTTRVLAEAKVDAKNNRTATLTARFMVFAPKVWFVPLSRVPLELLTKK